MREGYEKESEEKRKAALKDFGGRSQWILSQHARGEGADTYYDYDPGIIGGGGMKKGKYFSHMIHKSPLSADEYYSNDNPYDESGGRGSSASGRGFVVSSGSSRANPTAARPKPLSFSQKLARKKEQLIKKLAKEAQLARAAQSGYEGHEGYEGYEGHEGRVDHDAQCEMDDEDLGSDHCRAGSEGFGVLNAAENRVSHSNSGPGNDSRGHSSSDVRGLSATSASFAMAVEVHNQLPYTDDNVIEFRPDPKDRSFASWMEAQKINKNRAYNRAVDKSVASSGMLRGTPYIYDPDSSNQTPAKGEKMYKSNLDGLYRASGSLACGSDTSLDINGTLKAINIEAVSIIKRRKNRKGLGDTKKNTYAGVGTPSRDIATEKLLFDRNNGTHSDKDRLDSLVKVRVKSPHPTPINIETNDRYSSEEEGIMKANKSLLSNDNIIKLMKEASAFYADNLDYTTFFPHDLYADIIQQNNEYRGLPPSRGYVWNHSRASKNMKYGKATGINNHSPIKKHDIRKSPLKPLPMGDVKLSLNMPKTIPPLDYDRYWGKKHIQAELAPNRHTDVNNYLLSPISSKTPEVLPMYRTNQHLTDDQAMDDDITLSPSPSPRYTPTNLNINPYKIVASTKVIRNIHDPAALSPTGENDSVASYSTDDTRVNKYKTNNVALAIRNVKGVLAHVNNQKQPCLAELVVERRIIYDQPSGITGVEGNAGSSMDSIGGDSMSNNSFTSSITGSHAGIPRKNKSTKNIRSYGEFNESVFLRRPAGDSDSDSDISDSLTSNSNAMTIRSLETVTSRATASTQPPWSYESAKLITTNRKNEMFLGVKEKNEIDHSVPKGRTNQ